MNKFNGVLHSSILVLTTLASSLTPVSSVLHAQSIPVKNSFWDIIFKRLEDPEPPVKPVKGTSRPTTKPACLISPDYPSQTRKIWNTKPLFLWQGEVKKIGVMQFPNNSFKSNKNEYLWTKVTKGVDKITYAEKPLIPGETYAWIIFASEQKNASPIKRVRFKIVDSKQHQLISRELRLLEAQLKKKKADKEAMAFAKAQYFAKKELWSDVLQQIYSVPKPSQKLSQMLKKLPNQLCTTQMGNKNRGAVGRGMRR